MSGLSNSENVNAASASEHADCLGPSGNRRDVETYMALLEIRRAGLCLGIAQTELRWASGALTAGMIDAAASLGAVDDALNDLLDNLRRAA